jgi:hypothetical protein
MCLWKCQEDLSVNSFAPISNLYPYIAGRPRCSTQLSLLSSKTQQAMALGTAVRRLAAHRVGAPNRPTSWRKSVARKLKQKSPAVEHWGCRLQGQPANKASGPPNDPVAPVLPVAMR